jgi:predicted methyltransferase
MISTAASEQPSLSEMVSGEHRTEANRARDKYRHPQKTLEFFALKADMTIIEIWPGKGWYTAILAPYLKQGAGTFIAAGFPKHAGPKWRQNMQAEYEDWLAASPNLYDEVKIVELGPPTFWNLGENESVDAVVTFRNAHNWLKGGYETEMFNAFFQVLKPGGILGLTDHRADLNADLADMKQSGYLSEKLVISLAEKAGFILEETSEINANSLDTKDHPKGVWTLPPTLRLKQQYRDKYLKIGESDRMTLRFRKPK